MHVADPAALHARLRAEDMPGLRRLEVRHGIAVFSLIDPDGNTLVVRCPAG
ncbi:hypothetical protein [Spirilliplanes yamanashiensis]|uniref:Glyoxalase/bleomycin resistance protein/dioxygenase n=1 Tax=Spirilliplanes yamanashiensis TaxID=42233 RepID=A0A8J3Y7S7_9ACTN|nr:hypothetical protein [Spirilliplanes yamanashiensis]MDP9817465.1 hypothetical protein [Spirilliplanes yamanashiensis]GIJ02882.1 hypothetical protein Sya03_22340 [Spirilliplanes yamanashiensis]